MFVYILFCVLCKVYHFELANWLHAILSTTVTCLYFENTPDKLCNSACCILRLSASRDLGTQEKCTRLLTQDTILIVPAAVSEQWLAVASQHTIHSAPAVFKRCYPLLYNSLCFVHSPVKSSSSKQHWPLWTQQCWLVSDLMNGMDHFSATSLTSSKIKSSINAHGKLSF